MSRNLGHAVCYLLNVLRQSLAAVGVNGYRADLNKQINPASILIE